MVYILFLLMICSMQASEEVQHNKDYQKHIVMTRSKRKRNIFEVEIEEASVIKRPSLGSDYEERGSGSNYPHVLDKIDFEEIKPIPLIPLSFWEKFKIYCSCTGRRK